MKRKTYNNPESEHEPKGRRGIPANTPIKTNTGKNPEHDTEWDHSKSKAHWDKQNKGYVVDQ